MSNVIRNEEPGTLDGLQRFSFSKPIGIVNYSGKFGKFAKCDLNCEEWKTNLIIRQQNSAGYPFLFSIYQCTKSSCKSTILERCIRFFKEDINLDKEKTKFQGRTILFEIYGKGTIEIIFPDPMHVDAVRKFLFPKPIPFVPKPLPDDYEDLKILKTSPIFRYGGSTKGAGILDPKTFKFPPRNYHKWGHKEFKNWLRLIPFRKVEKSESEVKSKKVKKKMSMKKKNINEEKEYRIQSLYEYLEKHEGSVLDQIPRFYSFKKVEEIVCLPDRCEEDFVEKNFSFSRNKEVILKLRQHFKYFDCCFKENGFEARYYVVLLKMLIKPGLKDLQALETQILTVFSYMWDIDFMEDYILFSLLKKMDYVSWIDHEKEKYQKYLSEDSDPNINYIEKMRIYNRNEGYDVQCIDSEAFQKYMEHVRFIPWWSNLLILERFKKMQRHKKQSLQNLEKERDERKSSASLIKDRIKKKQKLRELRMWFKGKKFELFGRRGQSIERDITDEKAIIAPIVKREMNLRMHQRRKQMIKMEVEKMLSERNPNESNLPSVKLALAFHKREIDIHDAMQRKEKQTKEEEEKLQKLKRQQKSLHLMRTFKIFSSESVKFGLLHSYITLSNVGFHWFNRSFCYIGGGGTNSKVSQVMKDYQQVVAFDVTIPRDFTKEDSFRTFVRAIAGYCLHRNLNLGYSEYGFKPESKIFKLKIFEELGMTDPRSMKINCQDFTINLLRDVFNAAYPLHETHWEYIYRVWRLKGIPQESEILKNRIFGKDGMNKKLFFMFVDLSDELIKTLGIENEIQQEEVEIIQKEKKEENMEKKQERKKKKEEEEEETEGEDVEEEEKQEKKFEKKKKKKIEMKKVKRKIFRSHKELDDFLILIRNKIGTDKFLRENGGLFELLRGFDRAFWLELQFGKNDEVYQPRRNDQGKNICPISEMLKEEFRDENEHDTVHVKKRGLE